MDDETVNAAARAISFLGEAALRASAADLVRRARSVSDLFGAATALDKVESARMQAVSGLLGAVTALEQVESIGRTQAVSGLLGAATALEAALGVGLDDLRYAAAVLARQCGEHREAAAAMDKVRRAAEEESQQREDRPAPPPWWLLLLGGRRWGRRVRDVEVALLADGSTATAQAPGIMDAAGTSIHFLRNQAARSDHLVELADHLVELATEIVLFAHEPHQSLVAARDALQQADSPSSVKTAVIDLEAAATAVDGAASAQLIILRDPVVQLATACQEYLEGSHAMAAVQRAAMEWARQSESAGAAVPVQNAPPPPAPGPGQGDERRSGWLGYALSGSLALAPYLAATNDKPPQHLDHNDRRIMSIALSLCWSFAASGAVCSSYARSCIEVCYAQLAARVGIYGINILTIYFFYWILGIEDDTVNTVCGSPPVCIFCSSCWPAGGGTLEPIDMDQRFGSTELA